MRREPHERTAEDLSLLAAWLSGIKMSSTVLRTLDVDAVCRTMVCVAPECAAEEVVVAQGDRASALYVVAQEGHHRIVRLLLARGRLAVRSTAPRPTTTRGAG